MEWHRDILYEVKRFWRESAEALRMEKTVVCRFGGSFLGSKEGGLFCSLSRRSCLATSPSACSPGLRYSLLLPLSPRSVDSLKVGISRSVFLADLRSRAPPTRRRTSDPLDPWPHPMILYVVFRACPTCTTLPGSGPSLEPSFVFFFLSVPTSSMFYPLS